MHSFLLLLIVHNLQKEKEAIECFDKAIQIDPQNYSVWYDKGSALKSLQKYEEAIECFDKAILINPQNDNVWIQKGSALSNQQKYQKAIECYQKVISINPSNNIAWNKKGLALHKLKQYKEAILCFEQAISICINPLSLQLKADSLFEFGNKNEAKIFYIAALEAGSNNKNYIKKQLSML